MIGSLEIEQGSLEDQARYFVRLELVRLTFQSGADGGETIVWEYSGVDRVHEILALESSRIELISGERPEIEITGFRRLENGDYRQARLRFFPAAE